MNKAVAKCWWFQSGSNPDKTYETLQYTDESTSCNCPGWTRRVDAEGNRSCKHTRLVHADRADNEAEKFVDYTKSKPLSPVTPFPKKPADRKKTKVARDATIKRKVQWE